MAKVKKMADGGLTGLGQLLGGGTQQTTRIPSEFFGMPSRSAPQIGGGGGGSAEDGIGQINNGASTVSSALNSAKNALGGGGGGAEPQGGYTFKKGGSIKKTSTKVTTASKNKSNSNW